MDLLRQRHLFALATYGRPPPGPSKPPRISLPGPPAPPACPDLLGAPSISGTLSGSLSGSRPQCGPSNSVNMFTPHPGTFLHTNHARNSSNSGLCFQQLAHSFIFPYPASPVFATLTRTDGVYTNNSQLGTNLLSLATGFKFFIFIFFRTLLHSRKDQFFSFHTLPDSLHKTPGVGVGLQWHS